MNFPSQLSDEKRRVLLVDDSLEELQLLSGMLRASNFRLSVASDGRQGYQRAVVSQPDLILLDVVMPGLDGFSTCRLLKADPATCHIPIIFLTAKNAPEERLQGLKLGGVDYISKPVLAEEVLMRVSIHLNRTLTSHAPDEEGKAQVARRPDDAIFGAAQDLIRDMLDQLPSVSELARTVGTHEKKLGQIFRERLGMTVSAFIAEERIVVARRLLVETGMAIQSVAEQVGFDSAANFSTAFRKRMGMTPSVYRQAFQESGGVSP